MQNIFLLVAAGSGGGGSRLPIISISISISYSSYVLFGPLPLSQNISHKTTHTHTTRLYDPLPIPSHFSIELDYISVFCPFVFSYLSFRSKKKEPSQPAKPRPSQEQMRMNVLPRYPPRLFFFFLLSSSCCFPYPLGCSIFGHGERRGEGREEKGWKREKWRETGDGRVR